MRFSLITTGGERPVELRRFCDSVAAQGSHLVELVFINQSAMPCRLADAGYSFPLTVVEIGHRIPLSRARNIGLKGKLGDVCAFPDDDCWYPPNLLERVDDWFARHPALSVLCTNVFDPVAGRPYGNRPVGIQCPVTFRNLFRLPISVGIFVRTPALRAVGLYFDEQLGAGTRLGSGEESEILARLLSQGFKAAYDGSISVYHSCDDLGSLNPSRTEAYALGFGHLNRRMLLMRRFAVFPFYVEVILRSLGGAVLHLSDTSRRSNYIARARGAMRGLLIRDQHRNAR